MTSTLIADVDQFAGMIDPLGPGHFADVDQAFDPIFQLDEGPVGHHVDDFAGDRLPTGYFSSTFSHGLGRLLLQAEGDLLLLVVDVQDHDLKLVVDLDHLRGMADAAPAHVGDVQQAVDAAEVDERTEVGDVLDDALAELSLFDFGEHLLFELLAFVFNQLTARDDDVAADSSIFRITQHSMSWPM